MKKIFLASLFLTIILIAPKPTLAVNLYTDGTGGFLPGPTEYQQALSATGANLEKFSLAQLNSTVQGLNKILTGIPTLPGERANGGAIGGITNLIATLYITPPVSSTEYLADLGKNIGLIKPAYAQVGTGTTVLRPVLDLWIIMRNITYLVFVVIFVVIGFMIMFRKKIDPRTVASVQDALPRIVITLILVTFSYALVGLIIDFSEVATYLIATILQTFSNTPVSDFLATFHKTGVGSNNVFSIITPLVSSNFLASFIDPIQALFVSAPVIGFIANIPGFGNLVSLVIAVALISAVFKIFFNLLTAYITIILSAIFAPFQLLLNALPGNNAVGGWFRNLFSSILVFPATFLMLFIAAIFAKIPDPGTSNPWDINNPMQPVGFDWTPIPLGMYGSDASFIRELIAFGIVLATPKIGDIIKDMLSVKASPIGEHITRDVKSAASQIPIIGSFVR